MYSQHQLEVFQISLKGRQDAQEFSGVAHCIAVVARELELKRTYLKLLKRLRVALAPLVDQQISDKPNLKSTNSSFELLSTHIKPLCLDTRTQSLCEKLNKAFWSLKDELSSSSDSESFFLEVVEGRREEAGRVGRQIDELLPPKRTVRVEDFFYWIEIDNSLNRVKIQGSTRQLIGKRVARFYLKNTRHCDCLGRLLIVSHQNSYGTLFCIDLTRDFSSVCMPKMLYPRSNQGMIFYEGFVYAVGGLSSRGKVYQCERYSLQANKWESFEKVPVVYKAPSLTTLNRHLYAIGRAQNLSSEIILELCLLTLNWSLLIVSMPSVSPLTPLLVRDLNPDSEFLLFRTYDIWSFDPSTGSQRFIISVQKRDYLNIESIVASNKLYCQDYYRSLVIIDLPSLT
mmetsp:Transcript_26175/g.46668  ORF Transcript_26175/g.46668 Transcript_26175/m.46668 type:complete len:399 (-) Transcript_26175:193-1389(-)